VGVVSLTRYGLHNHLTYLDVLAFLSRHGEHYFANNSVNGILNSYFSPKDALICGDIDFTSYVPIVYAGTVLATLTSICLIVLPPLLWRRNCVPNAEMLGAAAICTVAGSPVAWEHHYGILLPIYLIALRAALRIPAGPPRWIILTTIFLSWILVADFIPFALLLAHTPFRFAAAHCFFGALLLLFALFGTQREQKALVPGCP
jgi:alpha-1,2-mannosyltransferase